MKRINFDFSKLKGRIREKLGTQENFAKQLKISTPALVKKLNNQSQFSQTEICKTREILDISDEELNLYFFSERN